jgi:hypothetical protein
MASASKKSKLGSTLARGVFLDSMQFHPASVNPIREANSVPN